MENVRHQQVIMEREDEILKLEDELRGLSKREKPPMKKKIATLKTELGLLKKVQRERAQAAGGEVCDDSEHVGPEISDLPKNAGTRWVLC